MFADHDNGSDWERSGATTTIEPKSPGAANESISDVDGDGIADADDNCPRDGNVDQSNADADGLGDACDDCPNDAANDADADGVCGDQDNCPNTPNSNQLDGDSDRLPLRTDTWPNKDLPMRPTLNLSRPTGDHRIHEGFRKVLRGHE